MAWTDFVSVSGYKLTQRDSLKGFQIGEVCRDGIGLSLHHPRPSPGVLILRETHWEWRLASPSDLHL